jgi:hypothetical protein
MQGAARAAATGRSQQPQPLRGPGGRRGGSSAIQGHPGARPRRRWAPGGLRGYAAASGDPGNVPRAGVTVTLSPPRDVSTRPGRRGGAPVKWPVTAWLPPCAALELTGPRGARGVPAATQRRGPVPAAVSPALHGRSSSPLGAPAGPAPMAEAAAPSSWSVSQHRLPSGPALIGLPLFARAHWPAQRPCSLARAVRGGGYSFAPPPRGCLPESCFSVLRVCARVLRPLCSVRPPSRGTENRERACNSDLDVP